MTEAQLLIFNTTLLKSILAIILPVIIAGVSTGILINIFQSISQIQEQSMAIIPKMIIILAVILFFSPMWLHKILEIIRNVVIQLPDILR